MVNVIVDVDAPNEGREFIDAAAQTWLTLHIFAIIGAVGTKVQIGNTFLAIARLEGFRGCTTFVALPIAETLSTESACSSNVVVPRVTAGAA